MMNEFQRRILAEAAKYGGAATSKNEQMAKAINEAPALAPSAVTSMFGYSKQQFEMKMRQLIQKMGFEKGINKMEVADKKMVLYFANAAKARDFIITFNGLTKRQSKGSPASISTSFDKVKAPAGTNAIVTVDFTMLKTEGMDRESHLFLMLESLHEQYITEGAMKAAIEDFMYSIPDAAIKDLKPVMKITNISRRFSEITKVLRKHGFPTMSKTLGSNSSNIINDYYDTFFGESVEVAEDFKAGDKVKVPHKGKMVSGKIVRFDDGGTSKAQQHGGGYVVDVGEPASILVPKQKVQKEETEVSEAKVKYLTGPGKRDPKRIIGIYNMQGKWIKDMNSEREAMTFVNKSWGESVEEEEELVTEVQTPERAKEMKQILNAAYKKQQADLQKAFKAGADEGDPVINKIDREMRKLDKLNDQERASKTKLFGKGGKIVKEEEELDEAEWGGGFETSREAQANVQAGLRADAKKRQALILSALQQVIDGKMSKPSFKKLTGSSFQDIMSLPFYSKKVKMKKEEVESVEEAYAHPDEKVIGQFYEKTGKKAFEYRMSKDSWGKSHDLPHEVCVSRKDPSSKGDWRAANVKGTVCYIAVDEGEGGKPVIEKWDIKKHVKYVKAD